MNVTMVSMFVLSLSGVALHVMRSAWPRSRERGQSSVWGSNRDERNGFRLVAIVLIEIVFDELACSVLAAEWAVNLMRNPRVRVADNHGVDHDCTAPRNAARISASVSRCSSRRGDPVRSAMYCREASVWIAFMVRCRRRRESAKVALTIAPRGVGEPQSGSK